METSPNKWVSVGEVVHSVKRYSANKINKLRGISGALWQDEYFDRIVRNEREYEEKRGYIANNPIKTGLADTEPYPWVWDESEHAEGPAAMELPDAGSHRLKTGATGSHRLKTGATPRAGSQPVDTGATCVFVKHTNASGVGVADDPIEAYRRAYLGDPNAAMGGILACSFHVDGEFATAVMNTYDRWGRDAGAGGFFVEVWIAPFFDSAAKEVITTSKKWGKRVRLLSVGDLGHPADHGDLDYRKIAGGMLIQTRDTVGLDEDEWGVVTERAPTDSELADLRLAWLVCKHTKSNAITICTDNMLIGNGAGQMSRVMSCRIATWLAKDNGHAERLAGSAAASDAFFPFADGPNILMDAGVTAIIQPGGSKRDEDTIKACNDRNAAMIFTGIRHFKH
jgi:hypothetical protein